MIPCDYAYSSYTFPLDPGYIQSLKLKPNHLVNIKTSRNSLNLQNITAALRLKVTTKSCS